MEKLFLKWLSTYQRKYHPKFQRDGIIDKRAYNKEKRKLLFVMLEPNSRSWETNRSYDMDLRFICRERTPDKPFTQNLALWTRGILERNFYYEKLCLEEINKYLRRVAIINLKKIGGTGKANLEAISILSWKDRHFTKSQVELIRPNVVVTCGEPANKLFYWIMNNNIFQKVEDKIWHIDYIEVWSANHPSLRPINAKKALETIQKLTNEVR